MTERPISTITIGKRHRRDVGDITSLAASIRDVGLLHPPVITPDGRLIAGERRLRACESLGWKSVQVRVVDLADVTRGEAAENFERQDFTPSEAVAIKQTLEPQLKAEAEARMLAGRPCANFAQGKAREHTAAFTGYSHETLRKAEAVVAAAEAEPEKYGRLLEDMDRKGLVNGVYRRLMNTRHAERIRAEPPPLPGGRYHVISIDPPWPYELMDEAPERRGLVPYPTMTVQDICALPIASLAQDNCILWCWFTNFHLLEGTATVVLDAWGFKPKMILTWVKPRFGCGLWLRNQTEHAILAVRGNPRVTLTNQSTALFAPVGAHSEKPDEFYALVESLCPAPRYLELFARKARPGWDVWGDEVPPPPDELTTALSSIRPAPANSSGTPDIELRYVPHASVEQFAAAGWTATAGLEGTHHGEYAVLMQRPAPA